MYNIPLHIKKLYLLGILWECMEKARYHEQYLFLTFEYEFNCLKETPPEKYFPISKYVFKDYIEYLNKPLALSQDNFL